MHCVAVEHIFSHVRVIRLAVLCAVEDKMDGICTYFFNSFPHVYDYFPCSLWKGVIMFIIIVLCLCLDLHGPLYHPYECCTG